MQHRKEVPDIYLLNEIMTPNEIRCLLGMRPIEKPDHKLPTNCPNCGAPINSYKCEYCDTIFNFNQR